MLGTLIGAERQYRQRGGGLRTHVLVAVGAATFVDIGMHLNGNAGATQIIAYVVSGVGFLGAGVIMKQGNNVWGLNTAATLWCSAAVGACAGADLAFEAIAADRLSCSPATRCCARWSTPSIARRSTRARPKRSTRCACTTSADDLDDVRELLRDAAGSRQLSAAGHRGHRARTTGDIELVATLLGTAADPAELDAIVARLESNPTVDRRQLEPAADGIIDAAALAREMSETESPMAAYQLHAMFNGEGNIALGQSRCKSKRHKKPDRNV